MIYAVSFFSFLGSLQSMELLKEVIDTINKNYIQMNKEFKSIGHVSKIMKLKGIHELVRLLMDIQEDSFVSSLAIRIQDKQY
jgi:hypothetical protein